MGGNNNSSVLEKKKKLIIIRETQILATVTPLCLLGVERAADVVESKGVWVQRTA